MADQIKTRQSTTHIAPFGLRMQPELKAKLEEAASASGRSLNAEIVKRLEWALSLVAAPEVKSSEPAPTSDLPFMIKQEVNDLAVAAGVPFEEMVARVFLAGIHKDAPQVLYIPVLPGATVQDMRAAFEASRDYVRPDAAIVSEKVGYSVPTPSNAAEATQKISNKTSDPSKKTS